MPFDDAPRPDRRPDDPVGIVLRQVIARVEGETGLPVPDHLKRKLRRLIETEVERELRVRRA